MLDRVLDDTYRLIEEIGKGGFGAVYKGVRKDYEGMGPVAIKVLNRNPAMKPKDYARFQREASIMSRLVHPGIVSVYELVHADSCYYIVMELVGGSNLREYVSARGGLLSLTEILEILIQCADALEYVHGLRIEHRDIKPQNILICDRGANRDTRLQVKLVDFGVARLSPHALGGETGIGAEIVGTFSYMAPEATGLLDAPIDHRSDIYSLGVVAFELLAGRLPFVRKSQSEVVRAHAYERHPSISEVLGRDVSPVIESIVSKCLAKNPADRYQSIFGLNCDLKRIRSELKSLGRMSHFEIASKDFDLMQRFQSVFVAHSEVVSDVMGILGTEKINSRLTWILLRGGVGVGKSRCLDEIRQRLDSHEIRYLYLRFSESEKRLPYQALSLAVNDYLTRFEKAQLSQFRTLLEDLVRKCGADGARQLAGIIPALRPFLEEKLWNEGVPADQLVASPSTVLNQAFKELFDSMVGGSQSRLVFLLDDIHLGDSSTIALLTYLISGMNTGVNFSVVLTIRDNLFQIPQMVEGLLRKASGLKRRFHEVVIPPFNDDNIADYLKEVGVENVGYELVQYARKRTDGSPLQLQVMVKQLVSQNGLVMMHHQSTEPSLAVDWSALREIKLELFNIESQISALGQLESRDRRILVIAAICQDPALFELFKVDSDFSTAELETRISALVRKGLLEESGDDTWPITRKSFALTHEKLRTALLGDCKPIEIRQIHFLIAKRMQQLFRNPGRAEILMLAKHIDGSADLFESKDATIGFLKAARVSISEGEHNLARYYIEKADLKQQKNPLGGAIGTQLKREMQEARYMIFAAQGNLVAASEVCRVLVEMTEEPSRKEKLQIYWSQLQLSLGRHRLAYQQSLQVIAHRMQLSGGAADTARGGILAVWKVLERFIGTILASLVGRPLFRLVYRAITILSSRSRPANGDSEVLNQSLALLMIAQLHGHEAPVGKGLYLAARMNVIDQQPDRWTCMVWVLIGALEMRYGHTKAGYRTMEQVERYYNQAGNLEALRWLVSLKAIWYDYPTGRMDRLLQIFGESRNPVYPTSGLMHFETYGLRAWLRLIAPDAFPSFDLDPARDRRRSQSKTRSTMNRGAPRAEARQVPVNNAQRGNQADNLLESNNARRVLDSGENGQFTALALMADAFRFALADKVDSLKRSAEQMQRQKSFSLIGDAFQMFGAALLAHVSGRHLEALRYYKKACRRILRSDAEIVALPVADALRYAVLFFPVVSVASGKRNWLWGRSLNPWLEKVDEHLARMEGRAVATKSAMSLLFAAMKHHSRGETRSALTELDAALRESRVQKMALLECLSLSMLLVFSAEKKISRASEHLNSVGSLARQFQWKLFERFVQAAARTYGLKITLPSDPAELSMTLTSRGRSTQGAINYLIRHLPELLDCRDLKTLVRQSTEIAARALGVKAGYFYLKDSRSNRFDCQVDLGAADNHHHQPLHRTAGSSDEIKKWLPVQLDEYVKLVALNRPEVVGSEHRPPVTLEHAKRSPLKVVSDFNELIGNNDEPTAESEDATVAFGGPAEITSSGLATVAHSAVGDDELSHGHQVRRSATGLRSADSSGSRQGVIERTRYLILIAVSNQAELLGWIALPDVSDHVSSAKEMEQELMMLGMHVGYLVNRFTGSRDWRKPALPTQQSESAMRSADGDLPDWLRVEIYSQGLEVSHTGWRILGVRSDLLIVCAWKMDAARERVARKLGDLVSRHLQLFVQSLRIQPERPNLEFVSQKLVSDFTALFGTTGHQSAGLESVDLNFLVFDLRDRISHEGVFGAEMFTFTGESRVDKEGLHEIHGIIGGDQSLIYRERYRKISGHCGWAFGIDNQSRVSLYRFADIDFMERYLPLVIQRQNLLPETLGVQSRGRGTEMFAIFALDESLVSLNETESTGRNAGDLVPVSKVNS